MNEAHVFQHSTTGVQIFVYHCLNQDDARSQFNRIVVDYKDWVYLGKKIARDEPKLNNGVENEYSHNFLSNMQYYMEYCQANEYVTPQDWLNKLKHYSDSKEPINYTEEEVLKYCLTALEMGFDLATNPLPRLSEISGKRYFKNWFEQNKK